MSSAKVICNEHKAGFHLVLWKTVELSLELLCEGTDDCAAFAAWIGKHRDK